MRFGQEIAGIPSSHDGAAATACSDLRPGSRRRWTTELSGNIIDLCRSAHSTTRPYRYRAVRGKMTQHPLVSPHDCAGTNLYGHVLRGRLMRGAARQTRTSTRPGSPTAPLQAAKVSIRAIGPGTPMVKEGGTWREVDWDAALERAAKGLQGSCASTAPPAGRARFTGRLHRGGVPCGPRHARSRLGEHRLPPASPGLRDQAGDPWRRCSVQHRRSRERCGRAAGRFGHPQGKCRSSRTASATVPCAVTRRLRSSIPAG